MSVDLHVYLNRGKMLSPRRWAEAIRTAGFGIHLDDDFDVDQHTGYLPCLFEGANSGFEYYARPLTDDDRAELDLTPAFDFCVTLTTRADLRELETSVVAAAVLAHSTGGILCDPQSGETLTHDSALSWVREQIVEIQRPR